VANHEVAILGVGMHPWGKWGRNFVEYGVHAAQAALADAGLGVREVQFLAAGETIRNGYPGFVAASSFAQALGYTGIPIASTYAACASGTQAIEAARTRCTRPTGCCARWRACRAPTRARSCARTGAS